MAAATRHAAHRHGLQLPPGFCRRWRPARPPACLPACPPAAGSSMAACALLRARQVRANGAVVAANVMAYARGHALPAGGMQNQCLAGWAAGCPSQQRSGRLRRSPQLVRRQCCGIPRCAGGGRAGGGSAGTAARRQGPRPAGPPGAAWAYRACNQRAYSSNQSIESMGKGKAPTMMRAGTGSQPGQGAGHAKPGRAAGGRAACWTTGWRCPLLLPPHRLAITHILQLQAA